MKIGYYRIFYMQGLITAEQLVELIEMQNKGQSQCICNTTWTSVIFRTERIQQIENIPTHKTHVHGQKSADDPRPQHKLILTLNCESDIMVTYRGMS